MSVNGECVLRLKIIETKRVDGGSFRKGGLGGRS